jgi:hypothetical protein
MAQPIQRAQTPPAAHTPAPRPRRVLRAVLAVVVLPILLGLAIVLVLARTQWGNERVRRIVVSQANGRMNGELAIGSLRGNLLSEATLTDVRLADSARRPLFSARRVQVRYALVPALRGRFVLRSLVVDTPVVVLDKRPGGRWNFQSLMRSSGQPRDTTQRRTPPELADVTIHHGDFLYRRPWSPDTTLTPDKRDSALAAALGGRSRHRVERVPGGYQRVVQYRDIDARIPSVRLAHDGDPLAVEIASLSMIGEPYREPAIDVRSLVGRSSRRRTRSGGAAPGCRSRLARERRRHDRVPQAGLLAGPEGRADRVRGSAVGESADAADGGRDAALRDAHQRRHDEALAGRRERALSRSDGGRKRRG